MSTNITVTPQAKDALAPLALSIIDAVVGGWSGRDSVARDKHIAELAI